MITETWRQSLYNLDVHKKSEMYGVLNKIKLLE